MCQCKPGFLGDPYLSAGCLGKFCVRRKQCLFDNVYLIIQDDDECSRPNTCGLNTDCLNTIGSFQCTCSQGYTGNPLVACAGWLNRNDFDNLIIMINESN